MSDLNDYQAGALRTAGDIRLEILGLGVTGEAGEVADLLKKHLGHGHPLDQEKLGRELGDVLWYVAVLASRAGFTLNAIAEMNLEKLRKRYPDGFSESASLNRKEAP